MCLKRIVLFSTQDEFYTILTIKKLFSLRFKPCNIFLVVCEASNFMLDFCKNYKIFLYQYKTNEALEVFLKEKVKKVDFILSIVNRIIIKDEILNICQKAAINLHPGLLPQYKGFFSTVNSIINDEKELGYTYHHITTQIDSGNILLQKKFKINQNDNAFTLYHKLLQDAIFNLGKVLKNSTQLGEKQNGAGTYYKKILPYNGQINPLWSKKKINNFIRAMFFPPYKSAFVKIKGKKYFVDTFEEYQTTIKENED